MSKSHLTKNEGHLQDNTPLLLSSSTGRRTSLSLTTPPLTTQSKSNEAQNGSLEFNEFEFKKKRRPSDQIPRAGFYIPPPGYAHSKRPIDNDNHISSYPFNKEIKQINVIPKLSHHDWSIPQTIQILTHWATLATLLGGVQATLLAYYSKEEDVVQGKGLQVYKMVIAVSCSALFLEVYGALMAAGLIVVSITLQAKSKDQDETPTTTTSSWYGFNGISSHSSTSSSTLSPLQSTILDRLTVLVGFIIPLGAAFELIGLAGYSAWFYGNAVAITMISTLAIAIVVTLITGLIGFHAGKKAEKMAERYYT